MILEDHLVLTMVHGGALTNDGMMMVYFFILMLLNADDGCSVHLFMFEYLFVMILVKVVSQW
jgi:hypothetical protein